MDRAMVEAIVIVAQQARAAGHGGKGRVYEAACNRLGISRATLYTYLDQVTVKPTRKKRSDAIGGEKDRSALKIEEARLIAAYIREGIAKNKKQRVLLKNAVAELRENGVIRAERIDPKSGEVIPLSDSQIARSLKAHGMHPDQLTAPPPATPLASAHPNHVWQIDASLCVLYKMPTNAGGRLEEIDEGEYYKNKMHNWHKVEHLLVQRYVVTDHYSGVEWPEFRLGGESIANLLDVFMTVTQPRGDHPFYGRPRFLMLDPGSANIAEPLKNLAKHLGMQVIVNKRKNPRAKGQVEGANNRIEVNFEAGLNKLRRAIDNIIDLNALGHQWGHWYNGTRRHTRHGMTRYGKWQEIRAQDLVLCPDIATMQALAHESPIERTVDDYLHVKFGGHVYSVRDLPGVQNREKVLIARNAWTDEEVMVVYRDAEGHEQLFAAPQVDTNEGGCFASDAAMIGEEYRQPADSRSAKINKELEKIATGADTLEEAERRRKKGVVPFGGEINPYKEAEEWQAPAWMPKQGERVETPDVRIERPPLPIVAALSEIKGRVGEAWDHSISKWVRSRYPEGVPEDQLEPLIASILTPDQGAAPQPETPRAGLRAVK